MMEVCSSTFFININNAIMNYSSIFIQVGLQSTVLIVFVMTNTLISPCLFHHLEAAYQNHTTMFMYLMNTYPWGPHHHPSPGQKAMCPAGFSSRKIVRRHQGKCTHHLYIFRFLVLQESIVDPQLNHQSLACLLLVMWFPKPTKDKKLLKLGAIKQELGGLAGYRLMRSIEVPLKHLRTSTPSPFQNFK